jgi:hypothetical protein
MASMKSEEYKIICHVGARVVASLSLKGELTIYHDHFKDEDKFEVQKFIDAFDRWNTVRQITHTSKRGLNKETVDALNTPQKENPGKIYFG